MHSKAVWTDLMPLPPSLHLTYILSVPLIPVEVASCGQYLSDFDVQAALTTSQRLAIMSNSSSPEHRPTRIFFPLRSFLQWDLVCGKAGLAELTQTLYAVGGVVGSLSMPYFSDTRGRKPILVLSGILTLIVSVGSSFSPNYVVFAVLRGLEGIFIQGLSVSCFTIMLEHFPVSSKTLMCGLTGVVWGSCVVPFGPIAYLFRNYNWRINNIVFSATHAIVFFQFWFLEESLRWVVTNGFVERSKKIIKRASKYNGVDFDRIWGNNMMSSLIPLVNSDNRKGTPSKEDLTQQAEIKEEGFHTIFQDPLARRITIIIFLIGNYIRFLCLIVASYGDIKDRLQRRSTMALFQCLSGASLLCAVLVNNFGEGSKILSIINTVCSMMGMFGISASYCVIWLYTPEVYPTNLRNIGLGFLTLCGSIGSMISPFSRILMLYVPWLPGTIFAVGSLASVCLLIFMPETQHLQMPTTMNDVRNQLKSQKRKKKTRSNEENHQNASLTKA
eukprot:XP_014767966.1 PREDICTED: solute carrier family 22 member 6-like [Octopus bimaculoides]